MTEVPTTTTTTTKRLSTVRVMDRAARVVRPSHGIVIPRVGVGGVIIGVVVILAIVGPYIIPFGTDAQDLTNRLRPPMWLPGGNAAHVFGTDPLGRDVFSRLVAGTRNSITVALGATVLALLVGGGIGLVAGYRGGWFDSVSMRIVDVQIAFPSLLLAIALAAFLRPGIPTLMVILAVGGWTIYARVVRGTMLSVKTGEFVVAARAIGATDARIVLRHIAPNLVPLVLALASFQLAGFIISEASLSFLGLGIPPPAPSWGGMLADGRPYLRTAWWLIVLPGTAIMITVLGANLFADTVRTWLDRRAASEEGPR